MGVMNALAGHCVVGKGRANVKDRSRKRLQVLELQSNRIYSEHNPCRELRSFRSARQGQRNTSNTPMKKRRQLRFDGFTGK